jgi:hypothetical protein
MRSKTISSSAVFQRNKYFVIDSLLTDSLLSFAHNYVSLKELTGQIKFSDGNLDLKTLNDYADPFMETLLEEVRPRLELLTGLKLFPTFSYIRVYRRGDILKKHKDRQSCEISVTLRLGGNSSTEWPIYLEGSEGLVEIKLKAGNALVYRGYEVAHWREPFNGNRQVQVFLCYVDQNGPFAEWRFDKRLHLGFPPRIASASKIQS